MFARDGGATVGGRTENESPWAWLGPSVENGNFKKKKEISVFFWLRIIHTDGGWFGNGSNGMDLVQE